MRPAVDQRILPSGLAERLAELDELDILDSGREPAFDDIVMLARELCEAPVALVSFVAETRQWFKAVDGVSICETPLSQSVCAVAIQQDETFIVPDLAADPRTRDNTLVTGEPHIRFYAGAILRSLSGVKLGTLCVIDLKPRPHGLTDAQRRGLEALARQTMQLMEFRRLQLQDAAALRGAQRRVQASTAFAAQAEQRRLAASASEARLRRAQAAAQIGSFEVDIPTNTITVTEEFCRIYGVPFRQSYAPEEFERLVLQEDRGQISDVDTRRKGDIATYIEYRVKRPDNGEITWVSRRAQIARDAKGNPLKLLGTVEDVTSRKAVETSQRVINQELGHRLKNTLAIVQAIARQTLREVENKAAVETFNQRVAALSRAHDILLQGSWSAADLRSVVEGVISAASEVHRYTLEGPSLQLSPRAALSLALMLHELATNAMKYGSLSVIDGRVRIMWAVDAEVLTFCWQESDGPLIEQPTTRGLGTRLIEMGLPGSLGVQSLYKRTGLMYECRAPLSAIRDEAPLLTS